MTEADRLAGLEKKSALYQLDEESEEGLHDQADEKGIHT